MCIYIYKLYLKIYLTHVENMFDFKEILCRHIERDI